MAEQATSTAFTFETARGTLIWEFDEHTAEHVQQLIDEMGEQGAQEALQPLVESAVGKVSASLCLSMNPMLSALFGMRDDSPGDEPIGTVGDILGDLLQGVADSLAGKGPRRHGPLF